jgi:hypothetical protein
MPVSGSSTVGEKPFEGFASTGSASKPHPIQGASRRTIPPKKKKAQEIARKAAAAGWGKKK